jgi:AcrR family transcriptional regulator
VHTIAERVGVTMPALYYHFEDKEAMLADRRRSDLTSHDDGPGLRRCSIPPRT